MPRIARVVLPGVPLHVTQRGIRRFEVFRGDTDRYTYLSLLRESCRQFRLRIYAYCLMSNHVHFVAVPDDSDSLWRTFHRCHGAYATRFNMKHGWTGHLWQAAVLMCAGREASLGGNSLRGTKSSQSTDRKSCGRLPLVKCGGALRLA